MLGFCRRCWRAFEDGMLVVLMAAMILVATVQIALRNLGNWSLPWAEPLVQVLLLWVTMVGAVVATREQRHLHIDLVQRAVPAAWRHLLRALAAAIASTVCGVLAWVAVAFVQGEAQAGTRGVFALPTWQLQLVFPLGFGVMGLRFAAQAVGCLRRQRGGAR